MFREPAPFWSQIVEIPAGDDSRFGISEEYDLANEFTVERTWVGKALFFGAPYTELLTVSYSANNNAILGEPAFDGIQRGMRCTLYMQGTKTTVIPAGSLSVTPYYPIVPGSRVVASQYVNGCRVPVNVNGNVVTLQAPCVDAVLVRYRPVLDAFIKKWKGGSPALTGTQSWSAEFEQWAPLS